MSTPCWPFTGGLNSKGRPYFSVGGKKYLAYRLAYELVHGEGSLEGKLALHQCDNEICCRPDHIIPGEHKQNMKEMRDRERHGLPHHTVRAIRKLAKDAEDLGLSHADIAKRFGLARSTVTEIINRVKYKDVTDEGNNDDNQSERNTTQD